MARIIKKGGIMSSLVKHAEKELRAAGLYDEDSDYGGMLAESVMELIKLFSKQGHSGCSAGMTISLFKMLANYETITPLTGEDDEWNFIGDRFQNKRNSAVFKDKDGQAYYIAPLHGKHKMILHGVDVPMEYQVLKILSRSHLCPKDSL